MLPEGPKEKQNPETISFKKVPAIKNISYDRTLNIDWLPSHLLL